VLDVRNREVFVSPMREERTSEGGVRPRSFRFEAELRPVLLTARRGITISEGFPEAFVGAFEALIQLLRVRNPGIIDLVEVCPDGLNLQHTVRNSFEINRC
jgi:hypothetical protein